nr:ABC transporter ATP-binding protein [Arcanobacterium phocae]
MVSRWEHKSKQLRSNLVNDKLRVADLTFRYSKHDPELYDGLSLTFTPGKITAITGESGRGKSTLLYILGLMLAPTAGTIYYGDTDLSALNDNQKSSYRAHNFGFIFQSAELDPNRSIIDSVCEPGIYSHAEARPQEAYALELLTRMGVDNEAYRKPGQISGGQAQRVAVCRALINNPHIILADEPTGNLDEHNSLIVLNALREAAQSDKTVLIATHDPTVINYADDVVQL